MPASHTAAPCLLLLAALASGAPGLATAQAPSQAAAPGSGGSCPAETFGAAVLPAQDRLRAGLLQMASLAEACDMRADYHAHRGALLLAAGWSQDAATALEKALLLNPELAGAQLDYAQALAQQGQRTQARELVRQVTERSDIQPELKQWLQEGLAPGGLALAGSAGSARSPLPQGVAVSAWSWTGLVQSSLGHETNLTSATHTTLLTLYLGSGPVEVPLADSERPRAGAALKVMAAAQGVRPVGDGELRLSVALQGRHALGQAVNDHQLAEGAAAYALPLGPGLVLGTVGGHVFSQRGVYSYKDQAYGLKYEPFWRLAQCKTSAALGLTAQRFISAPSLDGNYQHLRLEAGCQDGEAGGAGAGAETTLGVTAGQDNPLSLNRPGGVKHRREAYVRHERSLHLPLARVQGNLTAWYRFSRNHDEQVYSDLLSNAPTRTQRHDAGVGYWVPLRAGWSAGVDVESTSQKSTNTLLNIKNLAVYGGLRWALY